MENRGTSFVEYKIFGSRQFSTNRGLCGFNLFPRVEFRVSVRSRHETHGRMKSHKTKLLCRGESSVCLGGAMKRKELDGEEDDEKDTNPSKLDSLPLDLKMAILTRLPAKSLMKVQCVSKMWYSIIRSRGFIDSFFSMSSKQSRFVVAFSNPSSNPPEGRLMFLLSFSHDEGEDSSSLLPNFEMALPSVSFRDGIASCASFHGLLVVNANLLMTICNPSTEQVIALPNTTRLVGYDPIDNQYKALCFSSTRRVYNGGPLEHMVLTLGRGQGWRHIQGPPGHYSPLAPNVCINGFLYYGAFRGRIQTKDPVIVCFDVRSEKLSFINAPSDVLYWQRYAILIDYKGKLASIVTSPYGQPVSFDLWILEDVEKQEWSMQICVFPFSVWASIHSGRMCFPGTNKAGEIIMAPEALSHNAEPFYVFYYNVETKNIRRVRLLGVGDNVEFRRSYGFSDNEYCHVRIAPQHVESIAFF